MPVIPPKNEMAKKQKEKLKRILLRDMERPTENITKVQKHKKKTANDRIKTEIT